MVALFLDATAIFPAPCLPGGSAEEHEEDTVEGGSQPAAICSDENAPRKEIKVRWKRLSFESAIAN